MQSNQRKALALLLAGSLALLSACGSNDANGSNGTGSASASGGTASASSASAGASTGEKTKLVFWNTSYPTIDENDKTKKKEDFYIYKAIARYEAANPNVEIVIQDIPDGTNAMTKFQTAGIANNGPDVTNLWSGNYTMDLKSFIQPLNDYLKPSDIDAMTGWNAVTENFADKGTIYGVPDGSDGTIGILYNKKLFAAAGLDPEQNPPATYDDFVAMLQKLKDSGVTPIGSEQDGDFVYFLDYWFAQTVGTPGINDIVNGKMNFNNPKLLQVMQGYVQLYKNGFVTNDQPQTQFYNRKVALIFGGYGYLNDARAALGDDLGMMKIPDFNAEVLVKNGGIGGTGADFVVSKSSKHPEEAVKFILFLVSKEEQVARFKDGYGKLLNLKNVDPGEFTNDPYVVKQQEWAGEPSTIFWPDNIYPSELSDYISSMNELVVKQQLDVRDFLVKLDQKRDEINKQR
ncbi:ABC transporter substrate-binding protein [Cohnella rhizosphaerae]|uniref:Extracellular solute-binding protein n=1 Tax=Cohnella rhizosphaerae TaxID=1457232 RepID=A0A9X4KV68_9BACL|nr:extracellular solute-binding protein [Cohnella rhizosphaerae]MDG0811695.1 extracellular solute-binding protein [Cohnella rhizosphaerae]